MTLIIADNLTTGMTGGQPVAAAGRVEEIVKGLGVEPAHVHVIVPLPANHEANVKLLRRELAYQGPSVIISRRECVVTARAGKQK